MCGERFFQEAAMSELRFNRITGGWVIVATERFHKPEEFITEQNPSDPPARVDNCPFCHGNEESSETLSHTDRGGAWGVRLVRNKFSALAPFEIKRKSDSVRRRSMTGFGHHDVVIEHPGHNWWLWRQPASGIAEAFEMIQSR